MGAGRPAGGPTTEDPTTEETPPVPPGVLSEEDSRDAAPVGDAPSVDELFARIRAGTGTEVPAVVPEPSSSTPAAPEAASEASGEPRRRSAGSGQGAAGGNDAGRGA